MALYCDFSGSYYDPAPWTHEPCMAETQVPQGCPIHFVTGAPIDPQHITAYLVATGGGLTETPNNASVLASDDRTFMLPDELSCDCAPTPTTISFLHMAVDVPAARAGDMIELSGGGFESSALHVMITAPAACPAVDWPTDYSVALACDRCPVDPSMDSDGDGVPDDVDTHDDSGGCEAGGDPSVILAAFALAPLLRRRRAKILSSE